MDILTQALLGGVVAQAASRKSEIKVATGVGCGAALLADLDTLIRASSDPLLNIEFHRYFTHSLLFIPLGGLLAALLVWPFLQQRLSFKRLLFYTLLGYATHGLLDAATSYGTHLLWPFSDLRTAWGIIAIIDPIFSGILLLAMVVGLRRGTAPSSRLGLVLAASYLMLGVWQNDSASQVTLRLAEQRGHQIERMLVKPTLANLLLWRSIYESNGIFYVDAIRLGIFADNRIYSGGQAKRFVLNRDIPRLEQTSVLRHDIERFLYFSDDYVIADPDRENVLIDIRYSMLANGLKPIWGIDMSVASSTQHAQFVNYRDRSGFSIERFVAMVLGR